MSNLESKMEAGFSIVQALILFALISTIMLVSLAYLNEAKTVNRFAEVQTTVATQRDIFDRLIVDDRTWQAIITAPLNSKSNFGCLTSQSDCYATSISASAPYPFT